MAARKNDPIEQLLTDVGGLLNRVGTDLREVAVDAGRTIRDTGDALKRANLSAGLWQVCPVCNGKGLPSKKRCVTCDGTRIISVLNGQPPKRHK